MSISAFHPHLTKAAEQRQCAVETLYPLAAAAGLEFVEIDSRDIAGCEKKLRHQLADGGLRVGGVYAFFEFAQGSGVDDMRRVLDSAYEVGANAVMAVPGFFQPRDDEQAVREKLACALETMCGEAAQRGLHLSVENFGANNSPFGRIREMEWLMERVPQLGYTLDTGNFACFGEALPEAFERLRGRVTRVHLKDWQSVPVYGTRELTGVERRGLYPSWIGGGVLPLADVIHGLTAQGYKNSFAIEHFDVADQWMCLMRSLDFVKKNL